jgi:hypothetical protein
VPQRVAMMFASSHSENYGHPGCIAAPISARLAAASTCWCCPNELSAKVPDIAARAVGPADLIPDAPALFVAWAQDSVSCRRAAALLGAHWRTSGFQRRQPSNLILQSQFAALELHQSAIADGWVLERFGELVFEHPMQS